MGNRFDRGIATLAGLALAGTGLVVTDAAPAAADAYDCPSGYLCLWSGTNASGAMWKTNKNVADLGNSAGTFRGKANRTRLIACLYGEKNYATTSGYGIALPGDSAGAWSGSPSPRRLASVKFVRTERECSQPAYPHWVSATSPKSLGFGDMNGDRRADMITRDKAGRLWFTPGNGRGQLIGAGGWNSMNALTRHGDFDHDGREDLLAREKATGKLWLYPGTGTGRLGARKILGASGWNSMNHITAFGDLSGDGRSDLIAVEKATGKLWLYPGTSNGRLAPRKLVGASGWNSMNALVGMGDVTGDGRPDLYARQASTGKLWLYPGTSTARVGARTLIGSGGWNARADLMSVGDFSGDGLPDLATVTNEWYAIDGSPGHWGYLVTYHGRNDGSLRAGRRAHGEWWGLDDFC